MSLIVQLTRREIEQRYRGSVLGLLWAFLTPLFMLGVFTFVFAVVFEARWGRSQATTAEFALIIFCGLTVFNLFADVAGRAPGLVTGQPNLVKKVVFPLAILPVVALGTALFQAAIAMLLLLAAQSALGSGLWPATLLLPLLILPICLFTLGLAWFLAALGVYLRDIGQITAPVITASMFLSPIFFPSTALPEWIRPVASNSPLALSIEQVRDAVVFGKAPDFAQWGLAMAAGILVACLGLAFFQKTRKGFADVL